MKLLIINKMYNQLCFLLTGKCLEVVGTEGKGDGQFYQPTAAAVDADGNLLVIDKEAARVQKFSCSGECRYLQHVAARGNSPL